MSMVVNDWMIVWDKLYESGEAYARVVDTSFESEEHARSWAKYNLSAKWNRIVAIRPTTFLTQLSS